MLTNHSTYLLIGWAICQHNKIQGYNFSFYISENDSLVKTSTYQLSKPIQQFLFSFGLFIYNFAILISPIHYKRYTRLSALLSITCPFYTINILHIRYITISKNQNKCMYLITYDFFLFLLNTYTLQY